jgi:hypothetical protein
MGDAAQIASFPARRASRNGLMAPQTAPTAVWGYVSPIVIRCSGVAPVARAPLALKGVSQPFCFPPVCLLLAVRCGCSVRQTSTRATVLQVQCADSQQATLVAGEACDGMRAATECTVGVASEFERQILVSRFNHGRASPLCLD